MISHLTALAAAGVLCAACSTPAATADLSLDNPANPAAASVPFVRPVNVLAIGDGPTAGAPPMRMAQAEAPAGAAAANGVINAVDEARRSVNITHQPIKALGWPSMTMDFAVAPGVDLSRVKAGERIGFTLGAPDADGGRMIERITGEPR